MSIRAILLGALVALLAIGAPAAGGRSRAVTASFSGQCQFSGTIHPTPPITVIPVPGSHFSYLGRGTCSGTAGGRPVSGAALVVHFNDVRTLFDTCELGPDLSLHGQASVGSGRQRIRFAITVDLARLAVAGPLSLTASLGGRALGVAQFAPADPIAAVGQCVMGGVATASLSANFNTVQPLVGTTPGRSRRP